MYPRCRGGKYSATGFHNGFLKNLILGLIMTGISPERWDKFLSGFPDAHILQTRSWAKLKTNYNWEPRWLISENQENLIGGQFLFRSLPLGFSVAYLPKGPVTEKKNVDWGSDARFWDMAIQLCKTMRSVFLLLEPDSWEEEENSSEELSEIGFSKTDLSVQPSRTIEIDIQGDEDHILKQMKQKTRYNIKLAAKKGVKVVQSSDIDTFYCLSQITGERDRFGVHSKEYYQQVFDLFQPDQR